MEPTEDIEFELNQNYLLFKKIAKPLKYVFGTATREYELARAWLDKLETVEPTTLEEIRTRNLYMSHLVVCLNEAKLTAPFTTLPRGGQLDPAEFGGRKVQNNPTVFALQKEPAPQYARAPAAPKSCQCGYEWCNVDELGKQSPRPQNYDTSEGPNNNFCGYVSIHPNVPSQLDNNIAPPVHGTRKPIEKTIEEPVLRSSPEPSPRMAAGGAYRKETKCDVSNIMRALILHEKNTNSHCITTSKATCTTEPYDQIELLQQVQSLLQAVDLELHGLAAPGQNSLLEQELQGYKNFLEVHRDLSTFIKIMETKGMLRFYLTLRFQTDLEEILNDEVDPKKKRAAKN